MPSPDAGHRPPTSPPDPGCRVCAAMTPSRGYGPEPGTGQGWVWPVAQQPAWLQRRGRYLPDSGQHPARMLPDLARHTIHTLTRPGGLVLDPLAGTGTTLVEAIHLARHAIGVDLHPHWADLAAANARHAQRHGANGSYRTYTGDATHLLDWMPASLLGQVDLVLTSPPYGPRCHGRLDHRRGRLTRFHDTYQPQPAKPCEDPADPADLARHDLPALTAGMRAVLAECLPLLRPGGYVAITVRPWRARGLLTDLPGALARAAAGLGLEPAGQAVALLAAIRDGRLAARHSFYQLDTTRKTRAQGTAVCLPQHEFVQIWRTPPPDRPRPGRPHLPWSGRDGGW